MLLYMVKFVYFVALLMPIIRRDMERSLLAEVESMCLLAIPMEKRIGCYLVASLVSVYSVLEHSIDF